MHFIIILLNSFIHRQISPYNQYHNHIFSSTRHQLVYLFSRDDGYSYEYKNYIIPIQEFSIRNSNGAQLMELIIEYIPQLSLLIVSMTSWKHNKSTTQIGSISQGNIESSWNSLRVFIIIRLSSMFKCYFTHQLLNIYIQLLYSCSRVIHCFSTIIIWREE